jgi:hypothetical protein
MYRMRTLCCGWAIELSTIKRMVADAKLWGRVVELSSPLHYFAGEVDLHLLEAMLCEGLRVGCVDCVCCMVDGWWLVRGHHNNH